MEGLYKNGPQRNRVGECGLIYPIQDRKQWQAPVNKKGMEFSD